MNDLQGRYNTYYIGSIQNFDCIESNLRYGHNLASKYFKDHTPSSEIVKDNDTQSNSAFSMMLYLQKLFAEYLELGDILPDINTELFSLGLDSVKSVELYQRITSDFNIELETSVFFDYPTIKELGTLLASLQSAPVNINSTPKAINEDNALQRILNYLQKSLLEHLELGSISLQPDTDLFSLGLDSVKSVELFQSITEHFNIELETSVFFDYPTIELLAKHIHSKTQILNTPEIA